ncbi:MAG: hypothetical protein HYV96_20425 [Opitutae bacterium]|nr:hypothetical protein [Opitutae bacterium]
MTPSAKLLWASLIGVALLAIADAAPSAQFTADERALVPAGGTLRLLAVVSYSERPGAIGWTISLPRGWTLEKIGGGTPPQIAPAVGSAGELEFAYVNVPEYVASFELTVRYPAAAGRAKIAASAVARTNGRVETLTPAPLNLSEP